MTVPSNPKIYHIVHIDRLESILEDGRLLCDADSLELRPQGTTIGIASIKDRRRHNDLASHSDLRVGDCVPFYFCPRSVMLYLLAKGNHPSVTYRGGQGPILHLETDLREAVRWAEENRRRWAFTKSNAGAAYFDDYADLAKLDQLDWAAINSQDWQAKKEGKQAEFLVERDFDFEIFSKIGVHNLATRRKVEAILEDTAHDLPVTIEQEWYY